MKLIRGHVEIKELLKLQVHTQEHRPVASQVGKDFEPPFKSLEVPDSNTIPVITCGEYPGNIHHPPQASTSLSISVCYKMFPFVEVKYTLESIRGFVSTVEIHAALQKVTER